MLSAVVAILHQLAANRSRLTTAVEYTTTQKLTKSKKYLRYPKIETVICDNKEETTINGDQSESQFL